MATLGAYENPRSHYFEWPKERVLGILDVRPDDVRRFISIVAPNVEMARLRARMTTCPALRTFLISDPFSARMKFGEDLTIAATAIVLSAVVVTFNVRDFLAIHRQFPLPGIV